MLHQDKIFPPIKLNSRYTDVERCYLLFSELKENLHTFKEGGAELDLEMQSDDGEGSSKGKLNLLKRALSQSKV